MHYNSTFLFFKSSVWSRFGGKSFSCEKSMLEVRLVGNRLFATFISFDFLNFDVGGMLNILTWGHF